MSRALINYLNNPGADKAALGEALLAAIPNPDHNVIVAASYTLQASDNGDTLRLSDAASVLVTIPNSLDPGFGCGIYQESDGRITFQMQGGGPPLQVDGFFKSRKKGSFVGVDVLDNNGGTAATVRLLGDLGA